MAVEVGTAYVSVVPAMRGFTKNLRSQIGDQSALGRVMGDSAGVGLESSLLGAAKKAAVALAAVFAGAKLLDFGIDTIRIGADFQSTEVAFQGLIGDVELAQETLLELEQFARTTPFEFPQIADAAKKFLSFGRTADELIPILQNVGDAAATLGASAFDVNLVTRALGQIGSKGRVQLEELNQIAEAFPGVNPIKILAEAIDQSVPDFTNALSEPGGALKAFGLTGSEAVDILVEGFGNLNGAQGAMERQSKTLKGALSNLSDTFFFLRKNVSGPFLQPLADFILQVFIPLVDRLGPALERSFQRMAAAFNPLLVAFGAQLPGAISKVSAAFDGLGEQVAAKLRPVMDALRVFGEAVAPALAPVKEALIGLLRAVGQELSGGAGDALDLFIAGVVAALPVLAAAIQAAAPFVVDFINFLAGHPDALVALLPFHVGLIGSIDEIAAAAEKALPYLRDLYGFVREHEDGFTVAAAGVATFAASFLLLNQAMLVTQSVAATLSSLPTLFSRLAIAVPLLASPLGLFVVALAALAAAAVVAYFKFKPFRDAVDATARVIRDVAVGAFDLFMDAVGAVVGFLSGPLTAAFSAVVAAVSTVGSAIATAFSTVRDVVGNVAGGVGAGFSGVAAAVIGFLAPIVAWFDAHFVSTFVAGMGVVDAAIDLLRDIFGTLFDAIKIVVDAAADLLVSLGPKLLPVLERVGAFIGDVASVVAGILVPGFRLVVAVIGEVVKVLGAVVQVAAPIVEFFARTLVDVVIFAFNHVKSTIEAGLGVLRGIFKVLEGILRRDWSKAWEGLVLIASSAVGFIGDVVKNVAVLLVSAFQNIEFTDMARALGNLANVARDALWNLVKAVLAFIVDAGPVIALQLRSWADAFVDWVVTTALPGLVVNLGRLLVWLAGALVSMVPVIVRTLAAWGGAFGDWVVESALPAMIRETSLWLAGFITWIETAAVRIAEATVDLSLALTDWLLTTALPWAVEASGRFLAWIVTWVLEMGARIAEASVDLAVALTDWLLTSALPWVAEKSALVLVAILDWIKSAALSIATGAVKLATALLGWIADAVVAVPGQLAGIASAILGFVTGLPEQITAAAAGMWDGIAEAFRGAINLVIRLWNSLPAFVIPGIDPPGPGPTFGGFSFRVPPIQELASGAVLNSPTLAWMGEVPKARPEIVTPEALMRQVVRDAIAEVGVAAGGGGPLVGTVNVTEPVRPAEFVDEMNARLGWMLTPRNER